MRDQKAAERLKPRTGQIERFVTQQGKQAARGDAGLKARPHAERLFAAEHVVEAGRVGDAAFIGHVGARVLPGDVGRDGLAAARQNKAVHLRGEEDAAEIGAFVDRAVEHGLHVAKKKRRAHNGRAAPPDAGALGGSRSFPPCFVRNPERRAWCRTSRCQMQYNAWRMFLRRAVLGMEKADMLWNIIAYRRRKRNCPACDQSIVIFREGERGAILTPWRMGSHSTLRKNAATVIGR